MTSTYADAMPEVSSVRTLLVARRDNVSGTSIPMHGKVRLSWSMRLAQRDGLTVVGCDAYAARVATLLARDARQARRVINAAKRVQDAATRDRRALLARIASREATRPMLAAAQRSALDAAISRDRALVARVEAQYAAARSVIGPARALRDAVGAHVDLATTDNGDAAPTDTLRAMLAGCQSHDDLTAILPMFLTPASDAARSLSAAMRACGWARATAYAARTQDPTSNR